MFKHIWYPLKGRAFVAGDRLGLQEVKKKKKMQYFNFHKKYYNLAKDPLG